MLLAKSDGKKTIEEHSLDLKRCFESFLKLYRQYFNDDEIELIYYAIEIHDLGKINTLFQRKMFKKSGMEFIIENEEDVYKAYRGNEIHHGYLSVLFADVESLNEKYGAAYTKAVISAVYYHHLRSDEPMNIDFSKVIDYDLKRQVLKLDKEYHLSEDAKSYVFISKDNTKGRSSNYPDIWLKYVVIKGILNKIDFYASGNKDTEIEVSAEMENGKYLYNLVQDSFNEQNKKLRDAQLYMERNSDKSLVVVAPTGIGKTEGAILWLGESKGFYTLPLKVSINAIYKRIAEEYKYPTEKLALLHSDALTYLLDFEADKDSNKEDEIEIFNKYQKSKLLSYPLTICTADQIFRFVFKQIGDEIIPATLKYSKVIIDEIQMYSPEIVAYIIYGLKIITQLGGKFLIMTATFPPVFKDLMRREGIMPEFSQPFESPISRRHFLTYVEDDFNYELILEKAKSKKVLVLCNTVKKAQRVYDQLYERCDYVKLLHSMFIKKHRKILEDEIVEFSESEGIGIWISTQIVEASLDIDFDVLFTEMCSADSLLQRLGRCYRKREYTLDEPNVFITDVKNGRTHVYNGDIYDLSVEMLKPYCGKIFEEKLKYEYIDNVFNTETIKERAEKYYKKIRKTLETLNNLNPGSIERPEAHDIFRDIRSTTVMPDSIYRELENSGEFDRLKELINGGNTSKADRRKALDELMKYTLSVSNIQGWNKEVHDKRPIEDIKIAEIYRSQCKYDFGENRRGFDVNKLEISNFA